MNITRDFQAWRNGARDNSQVTEEVYEFYSAMDDASRRGPVVYEKERARRGQRDGRRDEIRIVWKRDLQGRLYQGYEDFE